LSELVFLVFFTSDAVLLLFVAAGYEVAFFGEDNLFPPRREGGGAGFFTCWLRVADVLEGVVAPFPLPLFPVAVVRQEVLEAPERAAEVAGLVEEARGGAALADRAAVDEHEECGQVVDPCTPAALLKSIVPAPNVTTGSAREETDPPPRPPPPSRFFLVPASSSCPSRSAGSGCSWSCENTKLLTGDADCAYLRPCPRLAGAGLLFGEQMGGGFTTMVSS